MATINIANLTFSHKGNYDGSTAYVKNDVVYYATNGNAYIAKQNTTGNVPTNATYWSQFAAGSGGIWNAGLSLGSAGQIVKVNSGASALEFGDAPSGVVKKIEQFTNNTRASLSSTTAKTVMWNSSFTTTTASSKVLIQVLIAKLGSAAGAFNCGIEWNGTNYDGTVHYTYENSDNYATMHAQYVFDSPGTPGSVNWAVYYDSANSSASRPATIFNPNSSDDGRLQQTISTLVITEFKN